MWGRKSEKETVHSVVFRPFCGHFSMSIVQLSCQLFGQNRSSLISFSQNNFENLATIEGIYYTVFLPEFAGKKVKRKQKHCAKYLQLQSMNHCVFMRFELIQIITQTILKINGVS